MQKINKLINVLLVIFLGLLVEVAMASDSQVPQDASDVEAITSPSLDQDMLVDYMMKSIDFEGKKNKLTNEIELERLKLELSKIKAAISELSPDVENQNTLNEIVPDGYTYKKPEIFLVSQVAGVNTFGVNLGGRKIYVGLNKRFISDDGKSYSIKSSGGKFVVAGQ